MDHLYLQAKFKETGRKQTDLAKFLGLDQSQVNKMVKGRRNIKAIEVDKIRLFFNDPLTTMPPQMHTIGVFEEIHKTIPLIGNVQAGAFIEAFETDPVGEIPIAGPLNNFKDTFALRVVGDSMNLVYPENTVLICQQLSDYQPDLKPGKRVIVKRRAAGDLFEVTVKEYSRDGEDTVLTPLSSNPKHKPIRFPDTPAYHDAGAPDAELWAVVLGAYTIEA